jgi:hypothetical protein
MNYATLLALLAVMAFAFPFVVRLAQNVGVPRSYGIVVTLALAIFFSTWGYLRWRLGRTGEADSSSGLEPLPSEPYRSEMFFSKGVFRGESLLAEGRRAEALEVYRHYRDILYKQGQDTDELDKIILQLERDQPWLVKEA